MPRIKPLPEALKKLLSAGEVVEGPHSVVKELFDNSLDAVATSITLHVFGGGLDRIIVEDNGIGMEREDLEVCFLPGYTSKVEFASPDGIFHPSNLGFRGEALHSISAVSRLKIESSFRGSGEAYRVVVEAGNMVSLTPSAPREGTRVEVERLFYNLPVRLKSLSVAKAARKVLEVFKSYAPFYTDVEWSYYENGRRIYWLKGGVEERLESLFSAKVEAFSFSSGEVKLSLYRVSNSRPSSAPVVVMRINHRVATSRRLSSMLQSFIKSSGMGGGLYYMDLSVPKAWVDHNVHPGKLLVVVYEEGLRAVESLLKEKFKKFVFLERDTGGDLYQNILGKQKEDTSKLKLSPSVSEPLRLYDVAVKKPRLSDKPSSAFLGSLPGDVLSFSMPGGMLLVHASIVALPVLLKGPVIRLSTPLEAEVPDYLLPILMNAELNFSFSGEGSGRGERLRFHEIPAVASPDEFSELLSIFKDKNFGKTSEKLRNTFKYTVDVLKKSPSWLDEILVQLMEVGFGVKFIPTSTYLSWLRSHEE